MCCASFLKIMMFIFNGGIFLAGAVILGVGIWVQVDSGSFLDILEEVEDASSLSQLVNVSYVLIAVGAVLLVIGFLGCCGAIRENKCMLLTFFSIVLIIFLIEVAGAIVLFVFKDVAGELLQEVEEKVQKSIEMNYGNKEKEKLTSVWDNTMKEFKCCGYRNYTDFTGSPFYNNGGKSLYPAPCCNSTTSADECNAERAGEANVNGCFDKLLQLIEDNALVIAGVAMGIAALEIAAMVVSMVLYCKAKKER